MVSQRTMKRDEKRPKWWYEETDPAGVDYSSAELVQRYDCHGGFLTYEHDAAPVDAIVSIFVLHHLPDFWKLVGLKRAAEMLKPYGRLFLCDIVFPSETANLEAELNAWVTSIAKQSGPELAAEAETHIRDEYSTYNWVMEGLLARAGFEIGSAEYSGRLQATYVCAKSGP